jgi:hypothetical protein
MLKLIIKLILFSTIVLSISYMTFYLKPNFENDYLASLKLKLEKLRKIKKNKIVIIGGSNVCVGINSEMIENEVGVPTVNMGLHATLGTKFWIEYVKNNLNEGDILIMSPEYGMLNEDGWYGMKGEAVPKAILFTPSKLPILLSDYTFFKKTVNGIFRAIKAYWKEYPFEKRKYNIKYFYDLRSFDEDNIIPVYLNNTFKKQYKNKTQLDFNKDKPRWDELKKYKEYFDKKNIKFYLTPPSVLDESINIAKAKTFFKTLSEKSTIPLINNNNNIFFKRSLFYDTNYHLNRKGIQKRTNLLIEDINKEFFKERKTKKKKSIFLSQNNFKEIELSKMTMTANVNAKHYNNDSVIIAPNKSNKVGFLKYKTEFTDYIGSLLKITVKCSPELINKLRFRGGKNYDFDYIKKLNFNTYVLCKNLSNVIIHPKDYSSSSIGIGYDEGALTMLDNFTILNTQIISGDLNCDEVLEYIRSDEYIIEKEEKSIIFKVKSLDNSKIHLENILNINSDFSLKNNQKYVLKIKEESVFLYDFYNEEVVLESTNYNYPIKFINSSKFEIEIVY